jgi:hypothetical protein
LRQLIRSQRFALAELALIILCGVIWLIKPEWGLWFSLVVLLIFLSRMLFGEASPRHIVAPDWLVLVFLVTAWVGYWAAYNQAVAWNKVWLVVMGVLLYYSLSTQPRENLVWVSTFFFCLGIGVSLYYFLTYDFVAIPRKLEIVNKIGRWLMSVRPQTGWKPIHPNYVAGMVAITVPFIFYPVWKSRENKKDLSALSYVFILAGLILSGFALVMATSRGVIFAIASGAGAWLLWRFVNLTGINRRLKSEAVFPILILIYLIVVVAFLYIGPAQSGESATGNYHFGNGSRAELFGRSIYLLLDYPFTGGGLGSFPGLYSQYLLDIPFLNVPNSHNLFLDVGIEQGAFGGFCFFLLYVVSIWSVAKSIVQEKENIVFKWVLLFSLIVVIVHGMVDDYLYNGVGSLLSLFLVGLSFNGKRDAALVEKKLDLRTIGMIAAIGLVIIVVNFNQIRATWYADLGAVQLAKVELNKFPDAGWLGSEIAPQLDAADASLHSALQLDPINRTANQRLGLILMYHTDFQSAVGFLEKARTQTPNHRGIIKQLGYCYVWLGNEGKAQEFLSQTPEAQEELDSYAWWWKTQGRNDLSENATVALKMLDAALP